MVMYLIRGIYYYNMVKGKKIIAVDERFFDNIFEEKRRELQKQLGIVNLSQVNFTKMISGIQIKKLKKNLIAPKLKRRRKKNDFFAF